VYWSKFSVKDSGSITPFAYSAFKILK
jgi:hypothetical protein